VEGIAGRTKLAGLTIRFGGIRFSRSIILTFLMLAESGTRVN
jgi:hypothetical protein